MGGLPTLVLDHVLPLNPSLIPMFVLEEPKSRKRQRTSREPSDTQQVRAAKKQKSACETTAAPYHRPPGFWDNLSKVRLSLNALREFDDRTGREEIHPAYTQMPDAEDSRGQALHRLKRFARRGGPDLSHLRGVADADLLVDYAMSRPSLQSRKRSSDSSRPAEPTKTPRTTPYSGNFEQKLIDNGIYPNNKASKPQNLRDIEEFQMLARASLSPSRFKQEDFEEFRDICDNASSETTTIRKVLPFIAGKEKDQHRSEADLPFSHLQAFDETLSDAKPDVYYGTAPSSIHRRVRADIGEHIIPSTTTTRPAAPNFFLEGKSIKGREDVAKRQALHDGAVGARAMHSLQNYSADEPVYDNNAYSYPTTYHAGTLKLYCVHPTHPTVPGGKPEYHLTQVKAFALTSDKETFVKGATAYRNTRDLAKAHRESFIEQANERACEMLATTTTRPSVGRASRRTSQIARSDTSEDELAGDVTTPKRLGSTLGQGFSSADKGKRAIRQASTYTPSTSFPETTSRVLTGQAASMTSEDELVHDPTIPAKRSRLDAVLSQESVPGSTS